MICFGDVTFPNSTSSRMAFSLMVRAKAAATATCSGPAMSILFNKRMSADSICSASNSGTLRPAAHSSFSSTHPSRCPALSQVIQSVPKVLESIRVTMRFISAFRVTGWPFSCAAFQFCCMATGSPTPLSSTTTASKPSLPFVLVSRSASTAGSNSSDSEQQAHPFCNSMTPFSWTIRLSVLSLLLLSTTPSSAEPSFRTSLASMFTLDMSLTITPILSPSLLSSKC
mmetsp:Transcript_16769/g.25210  ORF Transcript_16769/g.25210 Transcript_16769/m.25210 type:complete len:227 (+) Transcript_16769:3481-4161(+)